MNVVFTVSRQIKVNHKGHLLHINTTCQQVSCDQNTTGARAKFPHNNVTLALIHVSVHARDSEISFLHMLLQPVNLTTCVAVNDGLGDGERLVQIAKGVKLPLLTFHGNIKLLDTLKGQLILLHEDTHWIPHETLCDLKNIKRHRGGEKAHLHRFGKELEDIINLVLESPGKHLIGLIQEELANAIQSQRTTVDHVVDTTRRSHNNMDARLKGADVITHSGTSNTGVDL
mmetsp:Transcript_5328/g.11651  ORF Transcript_5328/g.11651 Transcript_5328/m.11651 type:complete len:229 (+) Transcript_5328:268-954(+)